MYWVDEHKLAIWLVSSIVLFVLLVIFIQDSVWWHYILYFLGSFLTSWFFLVPLFAIVLGLMSVASYAILHPKQAAFRLVCGVLILFAIVGVAWLIGLFGRWMFG
jgi:hypothetical protein